MNPFHSWSWTVAGTPAGLQMPIFLALALGIALVSIWLAQQAFRRPLAKGWAAPRLVARLVPGRAPAREAIKVALVGAGLSLLAVACARPYWGEVKETVHRRGIDVVVALDASRSMMSEDVHPDRLTQARVAVESLIDQLHGDRIGVVAFAKDAFVQSPLTTDYSAARLYLRAVDPLQMQQGGTDVGGALRESGELLARGQHGQRAQAVVLLTDGEDWGESASREAKVLGGAGVKLFTVAVGTEAGGPVPKLDARGRIIGEERDESGAVILTHANRPALLALAQDANGQSFDLASDLSVHSLAQAIDTLKKGDIEELTISASAERFAWFALPAFALMLLGLWLSPSRSRRLAATAIGAAACALFALPMQARADVFHVPEPGAQAGAKEYAAGHYDAALKQFQAKSAHADVARFNQGDALAAMGQSDSALKAFETPAPALQGRDAYNRGTLQAKGEKKDAAIASLRQALVADPSNEDARHNLEVLLAEQEKPKDQKKDDQKSQPQKSDSKDQKDQQQQASAGDSKDQKPKIGDSKDQKQEQAKAGDVKDQKPQPEKSGDAKDQQQASAANPKNQEQAQQKPEGTDSNDQQKAGAQGSPDALAQAEPKEPTRAERMLDALKAGDRLLPYRPNLPPERSTPDAHPW